MVVLVDTRYYGEILHRARKNQKIKARDAAKVFRVSERQLRRYEHGLDPVPEHILLCLFNRGFCMLRCQRDGSI
ncbi:MAG: hypothetical protein J6Y07_02330 [Alphaproteobacteria bacterium]|nr:hypothetical protein [Alphaproteobacteria bacterium]